VQYIILLYTRDQQHTNSSPSVYITNFTKITKYISTLLLHFFPNFIWCGTSLSFFVIRLFAHACRMSPHRHPQPGSGSHVNTFPPPISQTTEDVVPASIGTVTQYFAPGQNEPLLNPVSPPASTQAMNNQLALGPSLPPPADIGSRGARRRRNRRKNALQQDIGHNPAAPSPSSDILPTTGPSAPTLFSVESGPTESRPAPGSSIEKQIPHKFRKPRPQPALKWTRYGTRNSRPHPNLLKVFGKSKLIYTKKCEFLPPVAQFSNNVIVPFQLPAPPGHPLLQRFFSLRVSALLRVALLETFRNIHYSPRSTLDTIPSKHEALLESRHISRGFNIFFNDYLALCQRAVKNNNATISARALPGSGRTFPTKKTFYFDPEYTLCFPSIEDISNAIGLDDMTKMEIMIRNTSDTNVSYDTLVLAGPLLRGRTSRVGAQRTCILFNNVAPFLGYNQRSFCVHLPVSDWKHGDWITPFEMVPSASHSLCNHWRCSTPHLDQAATSFRIEWYFIRPVHGDTVRERQGLVYINMPKTILRANSARRTFNSIIRHVRDNSSPRH